MLPLIAALLTGCQQYRPECASLRLDRELGNHLQPYQVAIDPERRRVLSTALGSRNVALIDADTDELLDLYRVHTDALTSPDIAVSTTGTVWIVAAAAPGLVRLDLDSGDRQPLSEVFSVGRALLPLSDGRMAALGGSDDTMRLVILADDGTVLDTLSLSQRASALIDLDDDTIGLLSASGELIVLSAHDLSEQDRCPLPFAASAGARLSDGTIIVAATHAIGIAGCDREPVMWSVGTENKDVISLGDTAMVLDRIGSGEVDPNTGIAWVVSAQGVSEGLPTAKNTGFGAYDPVTDRLWFNSEGTTEILAMTPEGDIEAAVRTGSHIDGLTLDPQDDRIAFVSGRLSDTFARIEGTTVTASTDVVRWPYSPIVDIHRDIVWTVSQLDSVIYGLDRTDLSTKYTWDAGRESNILLTFSALAYHPTRRTLYFAESQSDTLLELDPDTGRILASWDLGGPLIEDRDEIGELSIRVSMPDEAVFIVRSNDARVQRLDPDSGTITTVTHEELADTLVRGSSRVDGVRLFPDRRRMYIGGHAVDLDTLARVTDEDLDVSRLLGVHPRRSGRWLAVSSDQHALVELTEKGRERGRLTFTDRDLSAALFRIVQSTDEVAMTRSSDAFYCPFDVREIR
jgi:DNA-binding beta-propeller fold protein YncE